MVKKNKAQTSGTHPNRTGERPRRQSDAKDSTEERIEVLAEGAEDRAEMEADGLSEELDELAATTDEELDALRLNLVQEDERPNSRDGSGLVVDEAAEERIARFTEADPNQTNLGGLSVEPGRDDTSGILRRHYPNRSIARSDAVVEDNLDEPMDESVDERKAEKGTAG
jgi:N utilization substance protein A